MWGKGGGTLLKKGFLLQPPHPIPLPKTFDVIESLFGGFCGLRVGVFRLVFGKGKKRILGKGGGE